MPRFRAGPKVLGSGSCEIMTCDSIKTSTALNLQSIYNQVYTANTSAVSFNYTTTNATGNCYTFPLIEYEGVA